MPAPRPITGESFEAYLDRIKASMSAAKTKHQASLTTDLVSPGAPNANELYSTLTDRTVYVVVPEKQPITGWRFFRIGHDGRFADDVPLDPRTLRTATASCGIRDIQLRAATLGQRISAGLNGSGKVDAISHDPLCTCGLRICQTQQILTDYLRWSSESSVFEDPIYQASTGAAGMAICAVEGFGCTAYRDLTDPEPHGTLRVSQVRLTGRVYIPQSWGARDSSARLTRAFADQYPGLNVATIPTPYSLPDATVQPPPIPSGNTHHARSGRWGRYGAAHALVHARGRYLIVQRATVNWFRTGIGLGASLESGEWEAPGGARNNPRESFRNAATREVREETGLDTGGAALLHTITTKDHGWEHRTFLLDAPSLEDMTPRPESDDVTQARWVTADELLSLRNAGQLSADFAQQVAALVDTAHRIKK